MLAFAAVAGRKHVLTVMAKECVWPTVVLFGDSLTQHSFEVEHGNWGARMANRLQRICDVQNRGFSGYNTRMCKVILPQLFGKQIALDTVAFVLCLGANDACLPESSSKQHVPLAEFKSNLTGMIAYLQEVDLPKEKVILMGPPPYDHAKYTKHCLETGKDVPARADASVAKYAEACSEVASACDVEFVDLYSPLKQYPNWKEFLLDGLHFSYQGGAVVDQLLWPKIEKRTSHLNMKYPIWSDVDMVNPENSLLHKHS